MPRMSKKDKEELSFFLNDRGRITYNELCRKCDRDCKQSFRAVIVQCPEYNSKRRKKTGNDAGKESPDDAYDAYDAFSPSES